MLSFYPFSIAQLVHTEGRRAAALLQEGKQLSRERASYLHQVRAAYRIRPSKPAQTHKEAGHVFNQNWQSAVAVM